MAKPAPTIVAKPAPTIMAKPAPTIVAKTHADELLLITYDLFSLTFKNKTL